MPRLCVFDILIHEVRDMGTKTAGERIKDAKKRGRHAAKGRGVRDPAAHIMGWKAQACEIVR